MKCKECGNDVENTIARGMCQRCYGRDIEAKKAAVCSACKEIKPIKARGMCRKCYAQYLRRGNPPWPRKRKGDKMCSNCHAKPVHAKGLCGSCYSRHLATGSPKKKGREKKVATCDGCGVTTNIKAHGLCGACYAYKRAHGTTVRGPKRTAIRECVVCGEIRKIVSKGTCKICYARFFIKGDFITKDGRFADVNPEELGLTIPTKEKLIERQERRSELGKISRKKNLKRHKNNELKKNFGITLKTYNKMLEEQNGVCAICGGVETAERNGRVLSLAVDHDHNTGKVRALLCQACNHGIGHMRDSPTLLTAAINYLKNHASSEA